MAVAPSSTLEQDARGCLSYYIDGLYMDNGYRFFGPEPAGGTLLAYELKYADGHTESGRLPHKGIQPRLLYHRHFMLTEQLPGIEEAPEKYKNAVLKTYANQLCRQFGASSVTLSSIYHTPPTMERILAGGSLQDEDLFEETPLGTFTCGE